MLIIATKARLSSVFSPLHSCPIAMFEACLFTMFTCRCDSGCCVSKYPVSIINIILASLTRINCCANAILLPDSRYFLPERLMRAGKPSRCKEKRLSMDGLYPGNGVEMPQRGRGAGGYTAPRTISGRVRDNLRHLRGLPSQTHLLEK